LADIIGSIMVEECSQAAEPVGVGDL